MNLSTNTVRVQVCQSGLAVKHRDKISCHGEICICFVSTSLFAMLLIPLCPLLFMFSNEYS